MYYGPVWLALLATSVIYIAAGIKIHILNRECQRLSLTDQLNTIRAPSRESSVQQRTTATQPTEDTQLPSRLEGVFAPEKRKVSSNQFSFQHMPTSGNQLLPGSEPGAEGPSGSSTGISAILNHDRRRAEHGAVSPREQGSDDQIGSGDVSRPAVEQTPAEARLGQRLTIRPHNSADSLSVLSDLTRPFPNVRNNVDSEARCGMPLTRMSGPFSEIPEKEITGRRGSLEARKGVQAYTKFACLYFIALAITWVCTVHQPVEICLFTPWAKRT